LSNVELFFMEKGSGEMKIDKVVVIANKTFEGISVINIEVYNESGRRCAQPTKHFIDSINKLPMLDEKKVKTAISRQYQIPTDMISFL
jgi:hypothetical protein